MSRQRYDRTCALCGASFTAAHPSAKFCSGNCRKRRHDDTHRGTCIDCGATLGARSGYPNAATGTRLRCVRCVHAIQAAGAEVLAARYEELWAAGATLQEIADEMGLVHSQAAGAVISMYRSAGRNFPYRRPPEAVENIRAGSRRAKAAARAAA